MKKLPFLLLLVCGLHGLQAQNLPKIQLQDIAGREISTENWIDGKTPFVVSFWMTTCKPCLQELDLMSENIEDWAEDTPFRIVAVSIDDSRSVARARSLAKGRDWEDFTLAFDVNGDFKRKMNVSVVPHIFVFDKDGKQVHMHTGYKPGDEDELLQVIRDLYKK